MHPVLFKIGTFPIGTYGLLLSVGFFLALALSKYLGEKAGIPNKKIFDLAISLLIAGVIGSKLLMIVVDLSNGADFLDIFDLEYLRAGGVVHGGIISAVIVFFWQIKSLGLSAAQTMDCLTPALALGQAVGRLGCFYAGCCYGTISSLPWAVTFFDVEAQSISGTPLATPLHPVQLYSFLASIFITATLLILFKRRHLAGQVSGCYFILEGVMRTIIEYWRGDIDRGFLLDLPWLSTGRLTSCFFIIFGIIILLYSGKVNKKRRCVG
jgi:phosphatidylglycerol:prolipoprotein diacylglycerol transferase